MRSTATRCRLCSVEYSHNTNLHDHIFTSEHLEKVKKSFRSDKSRLESNFGSENLEKDSDGQKTRYFLHFISFNSCLYQLRSVLFRVSFSSI